MKKFLEKYCGTIVVGGCIVGMLGMVAAFTFNWSGGIYIFGAGMLSMFLPMLSD